MAKNVTAEQLREQRAKELEAILRKAGATMSVPVAAGLEWLMGCRVVAQSKGSYLIYYQPGRVAPTEWLLKSHAERYITILKAAGVEARLITGDPRGFGIMAYAYVPSEEEALSGESRMYTEREYRGAARRAWYALAHLIAMDEGRATLGMSDIAKQLRDATLFDNWQGDDRDTSVSPEPSDPYADGGYLSILNDEAGTPDLWPPEESAEEAPRTYIVECWLIGDTGDREASDTHTFTADTTLQAVRNHFLMGFVTLGGIGATPPLAEWDRYHLINLAGDELDLSQPVTALDEEEGVLRAFMEKSSDE